MNIILFTHPNFLSSQSMPRYANMLLQGMRERKHEVEVWSPKPRFYRLPIKTSLKKWLGYIDQYLIFPLEVKLKLRKYSKDTLFVFADQAQGPWVPLVNKRPHVVHCHDFLALKSALGTIPENPAGFTGKLYQNYIRKGFSKGKNFISISKKTQEDLHKLHKGSINSSVVCYNGLNRTFEILDTNASRINLGNHLHLDLSAGYILHVGGNQYYKNRKGVLEIYEAFRKNTNHRAPLLLIGSKPSEELISCYKKSKYQKDIHFITNLSDEYINAAYSGATCLLFPSLDEGFGWPIAEAMASGCVVITTNSTPMTEVIGNADFFLIPRRPFDDSLLYDWATTASNQISKVLNLSKIERIEFINSGLESIKRFDTIHFIDAIEKQYLSILEKI